MILSIDVVERCVRVIYHFYDVDMPLYLITVYAKAAREDLSPYEKRTLTALAAELTKSALHI